MKASLLLLPCLLLTACGSVTTNLLSGPQTAPTGSAGPAPVNCHYKGSGLYSEPDPNCSPGVTNPDVTQANIDSTICKHGWTKTIRPPESVTRPEKRRELAAYHASGSLHDYELDHLVSLELGGAPNWYKNYWPEPNYPGSRGFYLNPKDQLENILNKLVCSRQMPLATAQKLIANNWVATFREYVRP